MKAGIFDPYLDTLGGGERYGLTFAEVLLEKGWEVDIFWKDENIKSSIKKKFSLDIESAMFSNYSPFESNLIEKIRFEKKYDLLFYFSDGSIPFMFGKNNILHFQVPFKNVLKRTLKDQIKLKNISTIVCNSQFTKNVIDNCLKTNSTIIYPPVDVESLRPSKKENIILSVGRFSQLLQGKRQDVLVDCFKKAVKNKLFKGWQLILAGGTEVGAGEYFEELKKSAFGNKISIIENPSYSQLINLYRKSKIFWTASGYGIDEEKDPEKVEHFGMTTVEAMSAGCVVFAQAKGGQKEIITDNINGFLWLEKDELIDKTAKVINDAGFFDKITKEAITKSREFSKLKFFQSVNKLINK